MAHGADADATDELGLAQLSISELSLTERLPFDLLESILCHADPPAICTAGGACRESAPEGLERHSRERLQRLCP